MTSRCATPILLEPPPGQSHRVPTPDGAELHVVVAGDGPALVLAHGALMSIEVWAPLWPLLLDAGHRLIAYDLRGHGRSTLGSWGFGVRPYGEDVTAVLDHFDLRAATVVAHSTGGIGVLSHLLERPQPARSRLGSAVLIAVPSKGLGADLRTRLLAPLVFSGLLDGVLRRPRLGRAFTKTLFGTDPDPSLVEFARGVMAASPRYTKVGAPRAVLDFDFRDRLREITLPALVLRGTRDSTVKADDAALLAHRLPDGELQELRSAGHLAVLERPDEIAREIEAFSTRRQSTQKLT